MSTVLERSRGLVQQAVAHALIADDDAVSLIAIHDAFQQTGTGKDHVGSLRLEPGKLPSLGYGSSLETVKLALYGI